jgi:hypothetical protein
VSATRLAGRLAGLQWAELETQVLGKDAGYGGKVGGAVVGRSYPVCSGTATVSDFHTSICVGLKSQPPGSLLGSDGPNSHSEESIKAEPDPGVAPGADDTPFPTGRYDMSTKNFSQASLRHIVAPS